MELSVRECQEHGGTFEIPKRRGRPPVRCTDDNPCTEAGDIPGLPGVTKHAAKKIGGPLKPAAKSTKPAKPEFSGSISNTTKKIMAAAARKYAEAPTEEPKEAEGSSHRAPTTAVQNAYKAKALLETVGWQCTAKPVGDGVEFTAQRNPELIIIRFRNDGSAEQTYMIWDTVQPKKNYDPRMPSPKLNFEPNEISDRELFTLLRGREVQWWNRQTGSIEVGVISTTKMQIEHLFGTEEDGEPTPEDRVIKFVDHAEGRFRAFRLAALIKVD